MRFLEKCLLALTLIACADSPKEARDMPIGPITPGSYVNVTPDAPQTTYTNVQAPTATMPVTASDIQALTLVTVNTGASCLNKIDGGTVSGDLVTTGAVSHDGTSTFLVGAGVSEEHSNTPGFINGATFSTGGTVSCSVPSTFSDTATFSDAVTAISCTGPLVVSGANGSFTVTATNGSLFSTAVEHDDTITFGSKGKIQHRDIFPAGTANQTYFDTTTNLVDGVFITGSTGAHDYNFKNTGAKVGHHVKLSVAGGSGFTHSVKRDDGTVILSLQDTGVSGDVWAGEIVHDGSNWRLISQSVLP